MKTATSRTVIGPRLRSTKKRKRQSAARKLLRLAFYHFDREQFCGLYARLFCEAQA